MRKLHFAPLFYLKERDQRLGLFYRLQSRVHAFNTATLQFLSSGRCYTKKKHLAVYNASVSLLINTCLFQMIQRTVRGWNKTPINVDVSSGKNQRFWVRCWAQQNKQIWSIFSGNVHMLCMGEMWVARQIFANKIHWCVNRKINVYKEYLVFYFSSNKSSVWFYAFCELWCGWHYI